MKSFVNKSGMCLYVGGPHTTPGEDFSPKSLWKEDKRALAVMWSSDFDVDIELPWWYCILDHPFYLDNIKSKRRAEIRKACKKFEVKRINADVYADTLAAISFDAWQDYSEDYRPNRSIEDVSKVFRNHSKDTCQHYFGCFDIESGELVGFANCYAYNDWIDFRSMKTNADCKNDGGALAIVCAISTYYMADPGNIRFICDGQRNIVHETNFQEFLVTKFGWRYAHAKLNVRYRPMISVAVKLLFPFRKALFNAKMSTIRKVGVLLRYEEIARECQKLMNENRL